MTSGPLIDRSKITRQHVVVVVLATLLVLGAGFLAGQRSSWGTKHPEVKAGIAVRANDDNGLIMFDADDGTQADMWAENIWWESPSASGDSHPECLQGSGTKARVQVGLLKVATPGGGHITKAVWLRCL